MADIRVILDVRCQLGGNFDIHHDHTLKGEAAFHLLLSGRCRIRMSDEKEVSLKDGDFVLLRKGDSHAIINDHLVEGVTLPVKYLDGGVLPLKYNDACLEDRDPVNLLCGRYHYASGGGALFSEWLPDVLHVNLYDIAGPSALGALIGLLRAEAEAEPQLGARMIIDGLGQTLLGYALRVQAQDASNAAGFLPLMVDSRLWPSVRSILMAPGHPWTIAGLGEIVAMSRATYARHFQARAGFSVGEFLKHVRMAHACAMLENENYRIADIAGAVGYSSQAAFSTAFRDTVGQTPAFWRKSLRASDK